MAGDYTITTTYSPVWYYDSSSTGSTGTITYYPSNWSSNNVYYYNWEDSEKTELRKKKEEAERKASDLEKENELLKKAFQKLLEMTYED